MFANEFKEAPPLTDREIARWFKRRKMLREVRDNPEAVVVVGELLRVVHYRFGAETEHLRWQRQRRGVLEVFRCGEDLVVDRKPLHHHAGIHSTIRRHDPIEHVGDFRVGNSLSRRSHRDPDSDR
ncbi:MAG: hypothetical protein F4Z69_08045 [Bacteroidetes bacterium SB0668_bin_1]|nr:hypothetical protein [Bacteroidetes bacterium SB0668_bin_1]